MKIYWFDEVPNDKSNKHPAKEYLNRLMRKSRRQREPKTIEMKKEPQKHSG